MRPWRPNSVTRGFDPHPTRTCPSGSSCAFPWLVERTGVGKRVAADETHATVLLVQAEQEGARPPSQRRPHSLVVEDGELPIGVEASVVLPREPCAGIEGEVAALSSQTPEHRAVAAANEIHGVRVSRGDEQVAVGLDLDRVEVEVVPRAREIGRDVLERLARRDVVEAPPLEQQPTGRHVDLLDHALDRVALSRAPEERQVVRDLLEDGEQGGVARREQELVQVARAAVRGVDLRDGAVAVVGDDVVAVSVGCRLSAPPRQDGHVRGSAGP